MRFFLMFSTAGSEKEGQKIGKALVEKKLAACVNVISGVNSFFQWEGKLRKEKEVILLIKTTKRNLKRITYSIKELHSYGVPEVLFVKIEGGDKRYLEWVGKMVEKEQGKGGEIKKIIDKR